MRTLFNPHHVRWSLGSADICFTNKSERSSSPYTSNKHRLRSSFFSLGQTLPTYRHGVGVFQEALDDAIQLLAHGNAWLHVFPEGRVRQDKNLSSTIHRDASLVLHD